MSFSSLSPQTVTLSTFLFLSLIFSSLLRPRPLLCLSLFPRASLLFLSFWGYLQEDGEK
ncbi:hypothetical protein EDD21DRAFT_383867 [Dissophora ornata]|nr:hypothetical protein EDD21DRAFT_383867 [Dissophora ornata]